MKTLANIFNFTSSEMRNRVIERPGWGAYLVMDNFISHDLFKNLCDSYRELKKRENVHWKRKPGNVWRESEEKGLVYQYGGAGADLTSFKELTSASPSWNFLLKKIYSKEGQEYFHNVFSASDAYSQNVSLDDQNNGRIGCKISTQLNNYGYIIHQDMTTKVLSFLLYLGRDNWDDYSEGGTDFWEVSDQKVKFNTNPDSIDSKLRIGVLSPEPHSLNEYQSQRIKKFMSVDFKPNRLVGFIRTDQSFHSVPPRVLPRNATRDCLQINVWNFNRDYKINKSQDL